MAFRALIALMALLSLMGCGTVDRAFYHPDRQVYWTPTRDGLAYEEVRFPSLDGTMLSGWFIPATGTALGTVIHFHGNAQNMTAHYRMVSWLPEYGFNLFVFDYRGYGASAGRVSREGIYEDSVAALRYLQSRDDIDRGKIIAFGQSLGGANAIAAIGNNHFEGIVGVVSESAFASYGDIARDYVGSSLRPVAGMLVGNACDPADAVAGISPIPLIIIHGTKDRVVPFHHAQHLIGKAREPKELWIMTGSGHTEALGRCRDRMIPMLHERFVAWVKDLPESDAAR